MGLGSCDFWAAVVTAAMSLGTAWVGVCALMFRRQMDGHSPVPQTRLSLVVADFVVIRASASLAWSDNISGVCTS